MPIGTNVLTSSYGWNEAANRYVDLESGRFISSSKVRDALEQVMDQSALNMNALSQQLVDGGISLADWQAGMLQNIKLAHTAAGASAGGGWAQMSQSDWGAVGQLVREQYDYLRNFSGQIASGEQPLDGRLMVRSDLYGDAARGTFEDIRQRGMMALGYEEERRTLEASDGNNCDGCLEQAAQGWQPIGTLDPIGDEECQVRCRCTFSYRKINENGEWEESE
jgi:hypothetical protein